MNEREVDAQLIKVLEDLKAHDAKIFTKEQAEALLEVVDFWQSLKGARKLAVWFGSGLKWFLFFAAAMVAIKAGLIEWFREALAK